MTRWWFLLWDRSWSHTVQLVLSVLDDIVGRPVEHPPFSTWPLSPVISGCSHYLNVSFKGKNLTPASRCCKPPPQLCAVCQINLLKPTGHVMHQQFNIQQLYVLPTLYLCVLYLSENKQQLVSQHKLICFYNRDGKCLLRGTNWVFK